MEDEFQVITTARAGIYKSVEALAVVPWSGYGGATPAPLGPHGRAAQVLPVGVVAALWGVPK